jgi:hypothetical protein
MTSASVGKSVHKPQAKRPPMLSGRPETASPEIQAKGSGAMVVEVDEIEELYSAVLCCTLEIEMK